MGSGTVHCRSIDFGTCHIGRGSTGMGEWRPASAKHCPDGCRRTYMKSRASLCGHTETLMLLDCRSGNWFWRNFGPEGTRLFRVVRLRRFAKDGGCCRLVRCRIALLAKLAALRMPDPNRTHTCRTRPRRLPTRRSDCGRLRAFWLWP